MLAKERFPFRGLNRHGGSLPLVSVNSRGSLRPKDRSCHWQAGRFSPPSEKADWEKGRIKKPACFSADNL